MEATCHSRGLVTLFEGWSLRCFLTGDEVTERGHRVALMAHRPQANAPECPQSEEADIPAGEAVVMTQAV